jgi:nucleotide-binding universal stress UspA family protein
MVRRILVAFDGSEPANKALDLAIDMAKAFGAELQAIHVISNKPLTDGERRLAESEYQADVQQALKASGLLTDPAVTRQTSRVSCRQTSTSLWSSARRWDARS